MSKEKEKLVLPKEVRLMMVNYLESNNILEADGWDDEKILKEYNSLILALKKKVEGYEVSAATKSINRWLADNPNIRVNDKDFLMRMYNMNIPSYYLHLFREEDAQLSDREIWRIINKSGISPLHAAQADPNLIFKNRGTPIKPKIYQPYK